jgi:murein L,D-transpeptidase YafK
MKTTVLLSCLLIGGGMFATRQTSFEATPDLTLPAVNVTLNKRAVNEMPEGVVRIVIDKSDYELNVYDSKGWYATYPVVFGNDPMKDKRVEGDRCTPEGTFKIISKRVHEKWSRFMALDYPTKESLEKFNRLKQRGEIPKNSSPGGGIGIHGTWPKEDYAIDRYDNWTLGCISLKNADVLELYGYVPNGTTVVIKK